MAGGAGGGEARSVALETAYVHDVYEEISGASSSWNCNCSCGCPAVRDVSAAAASPAPPGPPGPPGRAWPKVAQFLHDLEPGALVCDVGCGNGKYLSINPSVFKIGVDRCLSLTELARENQHEVLVCDNLALPFRDEAFDAVLSVAVVHHLATTERRVSAIRELARVLRIGGRLIITVWAMEQRHRKFESQDVLVPWHRPDRPQQLSTPSLDLTSTTNTSEEDLHPHGMPPYHAYTQTSDSDSCRSSGGPPRRRRHRGCGGQGGGRSVDGMGVCQSQSSSSLSSPNETCYSFVRRALQKLAGTRRSTPWFLDSWSGSDSPGAGPLGPRRPRDEPEGCEDSDCNDIQDLPIELRRLEEDLEAPQPTQGPQGTQSSRQGVVFPPSGVVPGSVPGRAPGGGAQAVHLKSKSLSDILSMDPRSVLVRSRSTVASGSSVPSIALGLGPIGMSLSTAGVTPLASNQQVPSSSRSSSSSLSVSGKPRLVKQKQSMCEEDAEMEQEEAAGGDQPTDMRNLVRALPDFKRLHGHGGHGHLLGRSARFNIFKQSSMNEELMSAERLREKERVRQNIQKQASLNEDLMYRHRPGTLDSLRDTLFSASTAKRFQLLKMGLTSKLKSSTTNIEKVAGTSLKNGFVRMLQGWTSPHAPAPPCRQASCPTPSSLTPSTPPPDMNCIKRPSSGSINGAEDMRARSWSGGERRHSREDGSDSSKDSSLQSDTSVDSEDSFASVIFIPKADQLDPPSPGPCSSAPASPQPSSPKVQAQHSPSPSPPQLPSSPRLPLSLVGLQGLQGLQGLTGVSVPHAPHPPGSPGVPIIPVGPSGGRGLGGVDQDARLQQIKEMLRQRNSSASSAGSSDAAGSAGAGAGGRGMFPLVRRASASVARPAPPRTAPRLLSLELFNPETDDVDSDSSGVSSPDSVDSVDSVINLPLPPPPDEGLARTPSPTPPPRGPPHDADPKLEGLVGLAPLVGHSSLRPQASSLSLLEAAADVASTLEDAVQAVLQASPRARRRQVKLNASCASTLEDDSARSSWSLQLSPDNSPNPSNWNRTRIRESASRFSLPGSLVSSRGQEDTVFKFPQPAGMGLGRSDSARSGRITEGPWPIMEKAMSGERTVAPSILSTKVEEPDPTLDRAPTTNPDPETPDPFGLHASPTSQTLQSPGVSVGGLHSADHSPSRGRGVPPLVLSPREGQVADGSAGIGSPLEEDCWDEGVRQHLAGFAEQLSERLLEEIERYRQDGAVRDLARLGEELQGLSKLSLELRERPSAPGPFDKVLASLAKNVDSSCELLSRLTKNASLASLRSVDSSEALTGVSSLSSSIRSTRSTDGDSAPPSELASEASDVEMSVSALPPQPPPVAAPAAPRGVSLATGDGVATPLRPGCSIESSDGGDFSERTGTGSFTGSMSGYSGTDSRRDTSSAGSTSHGKTYSSASLASDVYDAASDCSRDVRFADRRTARCDGRSSSEETPGRPSQLVRQKAALQDPGEGVGITMGYQGVTKTESCTTSLSGSTSQDSLPSDNGGGAITYHRYYHVFREGELDQLIERYVDNLHIISSYYDHTNWCVVAEKVQVWTI